MTFSTLSNIVTAIFCMAVLVQTIRLMRAFRTVKGGALLEVVAALDQSTGEARLVLGELRKALGECGSRARELGEARAIGEELSIMIGIADATAERLSMASTGGGAQRADEVSAA